MSTSTEAVLTPSISFQDIGPVIGLNYPVKNYGITVVTGPSGSGKSTILNTIQFATDAPGSKAPTKRDGTKEGVASVFGRRIVVGKRVQTAGELELDGLADIDMEGLHQPKFKDRVTRDSHRIKVLAAMSPAPLTQEMLQELPEFDNIVRQADVQLDEPLVTLGKVKRAYEAAARRAEEAAQTASNEQVAALNVIKDVDFSVPRDIAALTANQTEAVMERGRLAQLKEEATAREQSAERAQVWLEGHVEPPHDAATCELKANEARATADALTLEIERLQKERERALESVSTWTELKTESAEYERDSTLAKAALADLSLNKPPTEAELDAAEAAVTEASNAIQRANDANTAESEKLRADRCGTVASEQAARAKEMRKSAANTSDILTKIASSIPGCPLIPSFDDDGDPVLKTKDGQLFDRLSDGEKWQLIVPACFAKDRVLVLSQAAFGELNNASRLFLHQSAMDHECYIVTGEVTEPDTPLAAYWFGE